MTALTQTEFMPPKIEVIGPYSPWPRKRRRPVRRTTIFAGFVTGAAIIVHCAVPFIA